MGDHPAPAGSSTGVHAFPRLSVAVALVVAAVGVAAFLDQGLSDALVTSPHPATDGQWWRLVTPVFVQPSGWGQLAFNTVGTVLVGAALERRVSAARWAAVFAAGGVGCLIILAVWTPIGGTGGSSNAVAALIGATAVLRARERDHRNVLDAAATIYAVFFACYLTASAVGGVWPAVVVGNVSLIAMAAAARLVPTHALVRVALTVVLLGGCLMSVLADGHGWGLFIGAAAGLRLSRDPPQRPVQS